MPKKIAETYAIRPGDEIDWVAAGDVICVIPPAARASAPDRELQLRLFDQATVRHRERGARMAPSETPGRGWSREDLYASRDPR